MLAQKSGGRFVSIMAALVDNPITRGDKMKTRNRIGDYPRGQFTARFGNTANQIKNNGEL
jgi:hypothetical protein